MTWPTAQTTVHLDSDTDSIAAARAEIYSAVVAINDIIGSRGTASGVASLDSGSHIPASQLPTELTTAGSQDLTLTPGSARVAINNIINLEPRTVTQVNAITTPVTGDVAYVSNGSAGQPCLAVYNGTAWKVVALGSTIASS
jgi:hypothetical protein